MSNNLCSKKDFDILIVEDEPILAMAMEVKLKKLGFGVSGIATTPDNAILHTHNFYPEIYFPKGNLFNTNVITNARAKDNRAVTKILIKVNNK